MLIERSMVTMQPLARGLRFFDRLDRVETFRQQSRDTSAAIQMDLCGCFPWLAIGIRDSVCDCRF